MAESSQNMGALRVQGMNFIYTELRGLVMCQQRESAFEAPRQASKNTRPNPTLHSTFRCRTSEC